MRYLLLILALVTMLAPATAGAAEPAVQPGQSFKDCTGCPEMIVVPAGSFMMGSPETEKGRHNDEGPQHKVTIGKPFAAAKFELTSDDWDACVAQGGCNANITMGAGRGRRPAWFVNWTDAQHYLAWILKAAGKAYRLLTEAEYEYATRAGTQTAYPWGDDIGSNNVNCISCGSKWDNVLAPVGSFAPNGFGLYDMVGNVSVWVQDCYHKNYAYNPEYGGAPTDGSAWTRGDCKLRALRGGSTAGFGEELRSASRLWSTVEPDYGWGVRVARAIAP